MSSSDVQTGNKLKGFSPHDNYISLILLRADGKELLTASGDHTIKLWDAENLTSPIQTFAGPENDILSIDASQNWSRLISAGEDEKINFWDMRTGKALWSLKVHADRISEVALSADAKVIAFVNSVNKLKLWRTDNETVQPFFAGRVGTAALSSNSKLLAIN